MENKLMSDQIDQLATALAKSQGEMLTAGKNQKNPFFKSNYADFEAIVNASRPALSKYGLSVVQPPVFNNESGQSFLITILMHSSGQWIQSKALHNPQKNDVQSLSSYNTYLKRMCYTSLIGVATGDDDDGESSMDRSNSSNNNGYQYARQDNKSIMNLVAQEELSYLMALGEVTKVGITNHYGVKTLSELNKDQFAEIKREFDERARKKKERELKDQELVGN